MSQYFIVLSGQKRGPYTLDELASRELTPETMIWTEGMGEPCPASEFEELRPLLGQQSPQTQQYQQPPQGAQEQPNQQAPNYNGAPQGQQYQQAPNYNGAPQGQQYQQAPNYNGAPQGQQYQQAPNYNGAPQGQQYQQTPNYNGAPQGQQYQQAPQYRSDGSTANPFTTIPPSQEIEGVLPPNYLVWSIILIFLCLPGGIGATIYSSRVGSCYNRGDYRGAWEASRTAQTWVKWSSIVFLILLGLNFLGGFFSRW